VNDDHTFAPGQAVLVLDAWGNWLPATTASAVEGTHDKYGKRIHDFPVVWVLTGDDGESVPWPVEAVKLADADG
jgi:hypothetical protein